MSVKERLKSFINHLNIKTTQFEKSIDASNGYVNSISKSIGIDKINLILEKYPNLNVEWLLTGKGSMLKSDERSDIPVAVAVNGSNNVRAIPLVDEEAVAGFGNPKFAIKEQDVKEYYTIPKFRHRKVDFMIEVYGNSMYPKYNSGDIVAATIITESGFIQWNKPHIIATKSQGILVKRILKGPDEHTLILKSDNKDYPPFEVPKDEVDGLALIVGVIRLE